MKEMNHQEFIEFITSALELPLSVRDRFMEPIDYINYISDADPKYDVSTTTDEMGNTVINATYKSGFINGIGSEKEYKYTIKINQASQKYELSCVKHNRTQKMEGANVKIDTVTLEYTDNSWNNQPGYILVSDQRTSASSKREEISNK